MFLRFIVATLLISSTIAHAEWPQLYGAYQVGGGRIQVSDSFGDDDTSASTDLGVFAGVRFGNNIVVEISETFSDGHSLFGWSDSHDIRQYLVLAGYSIPVKRSFRITPKVGVADWKLKGREGWFSDSGDEDSSRAEGHDVAYFVELEWAIKSFLSLGMNNGWSDTDFGNFTSGRFFVKFTF
jgi:hypothetical protein